MSYLGIMAGTGTTLITLGVTMFFTLSGDMYASARHFGAIIGIAGLFIIGIVVYLALKEDKKQGTNFDDVNQSIKEAVVELRGLRKDLNK